MINTSVDLSLNVMLQDLFSHVSRTEPIQTQKTDFGMETYSEEPSIAPGHNMSSSAEGKTHLTGMLV